MGKKINNYFYQFEIQYEGESPKNLLDIINNKITAVENRVGKEYPKSKLKVNIISIVKLQNEGEYRVIFQKGGYGYTTNFIDKDYDFSSIPSEKDQYGRDSGKTLSELEEVHYYSSLKIGISSDDKYVKGIISVPRIREGITSKEISDILKKLFTKIFTKTIEGVEHPGKGYFRQLRSVYSEGKILEVFGNAIEINFVKDEQINGIVGKEHTKETGNKLSSIKMSVTGDMNIKKWKDYILELFGGVSDTEIKRDLVALKHFTIKTKNGTFNLEGDDFKLHKTVEVVNYDNIMNIADRKYFTSENINFIRQSFSNFFK